MNTPELNSAQEMDYPTLSEDRWKAAAALIKDISDPEYLRGILDSLNNTVAHLICKADEARGDLKELTGIIDHLVYVSLVADTLVYIATTNSINQNDHE